MLFGPLRRHLTNVKHLLIMPDDVLLPLPFGALVTDARSEAFERSAKRYGAGRSIDSDEMVDYSKLASSTLEGMTTAALGNFLMVCAIASDLYCSTYNRRESARQVLAAAHSRSTRTEENLPATRSNASRIAFFEPSIERTTGTCE